jgi:hypothetical protein
MEKRNTIKLKIRIEKTGFNKKECRKGRTMKNKFYPKAYI